jgi:hypothetical protein
MTVNLLIFSSSDIQQRKGQPAKLAEALALMLEDAVHDLTSRNETFFDYSIKIEKWCNQFFLDLKLFLHFYWAMKFEFFAPDENNYLRRFSLALWRIDSD